MNENKSSSYRRLQERVKKLEQELKKTRSNSRQKLKTTEKRLAEALNKQYSISARISNIRAMIDMPQLFLDRDWNIIGYSDLFPFLSERVIELAEKGKNIRDFLKQGDCERIERYCQDLKALESLPYDEGDEWELKYTGPQAGEKIGDNWIPFCSSGGNHWEMVNENGKVKIVHRPQPEAAVDCFLMSAGEYGGPEEDVKILYKVTISREKKNIRDLSVIISGSSGRKKTIPDLPGYAVCTASNENTESRLQRRSVNTKTCPEKLEPGSQYLITAERTGGKLKKLVCNLETGQERPPLEMIDPEALYGSQNHIGFHTFSGEMKIDEVKIYTRKSRFSLEQFRIPFDFEVGIRDKNLESRLFKLRLGRDETIEGGCYTLMFEDVTDRKLVEEELAAHHENLESQVHFRTAELSAINDRLCQEISERKRIEQALRESREDLDSIVKNVPDIIYRLDEQGKIVFINDAIENYGYNREKLIGTHISEIVHPVDRQRAHFRINERRIGQRKTSSLELRLLTKSSAEVQFEIKSKEISAGPVFLIDAEGQYTDTGDETRKFAGTLGVARDITERKRASRMLDFERAQLLSIFDSINEIIYVTDPETNKILYVNRFLREHLGKDPVGGICYKEFQDLGHQCEFCTNEIIFKEPDKPYQWEHHNSKTNRHYMIIDRVIKWPDGRDVKFELAIDITERRRAEEALREEKNRLATLLDNIPVMVNAFDDEGRFCIWNKECEKVTGYPRETIVGNPSHKMLKLMYPDKDYLEELLSEWKKIGSDFKDWEMDLTARDGSKKIIAWTNISKHVGIPGISSWSVGIDITERKWAEKALRESEERFRTLINDVLDSSKVGIFILDADFKVIWINKAIEDYFGLKRKQVIGKNKKDMIRDRIMYIFTNPEDYADRVLATYLDNTYIEYFECCVIAESERQGRFLEHWSQPIQTGLYAGGRVECYTDITERKRVEFELKEAQSDLEGRVAERTEALSQSEKHLQESLRELTCLYRIRQEFDKGAPLEKTLISCTVHIRRALDEPERRSVEIILDGEQLVAGEKFQPSDNCLKAPLVISDRKRGELRVYSYATGRKQAPLERDLVEQTGAILSSFIQNRELQEKLVQTEKLAAGGRVAAGVAHEINNPLGAIKNSLYILKKAISPHHEDYSYLELMETEISRVAGIITQLYDLYKPASQKPQLVELEKVVGNVLKIMEGKINRRKITVVNRLDSAVPRLNTSVNQLTQVLYNIIENAVQAIGEGGMLTIAAEKSPGRLELSISDTGPGIPDDVLPKIFEPFFTTKGVSKVSGEGMGLGLSLSRTIMESLGGGIALRTKQGAGTTFLLDFPTR